MPIVLSRFGPAPAPLVCAALVVGLAAFGAWVPIGRPPRTLEPAQAFGMLLGAGALGGWAVALAVSAWNLSRAEAAGVVLREPMSPGIFDLVFSVPLVLLVPLAGVGLLQVGRARPPGFASALAAVFALGLVALREVDRVAYVAGGQVHARAGWLWVRRERASGAEVTGVQVVREMYRGAPSFVVRLQLQDPARTPMLAGIEARFRDGGAAEAEAERWRSALAPLRGGA